MNVQSETCENSLQWLRGRVARSRSIGTRLTPDEEQQILSAAQAQGKALSEWVRDVLLRGANLTIRGEMEIHIFTELVGIQMLLMNTLEPLLLGDKITQEQLTLLFRQPKPRKLKNCSQSEARVGRNDRCPLFNDGDGKNPSCGRRKAALRQGGSL